MGILNNIGGILGGVAGLSQQQSQTAANTSANTFTLTTSGTTTFTIGGNPYYSFSSAGPFMGQWGAAAQKKIHHTTPSADAFKSLTAYIRKLLACEENCECKWCSASELERQVAIAQFFKEEPADEATVEARP